MSDVTNSTTAASASATSAGAAASPTVGQSIDAEIVVLKARVAAVEAAAKTDWSDVKAWVKTNWPHFVGWASTAVVAAKVGVFADIAKII
jgi:hypothetical protein